MLGMLRQIAVWALVAIIACGNGLSFAMAATHSNAPVDAQATSQGTGHHHHAPRAVSAHEHVHEHPAASHAADVSKADQCSDNGCRPVKHSDHKCCHVNAHCCTPLVTLPAADSQAAPMLGDGSMPIDAGASVPLGAIVYPLLRPPRSAA